MTEPSRPAGKADAILGLGSNVGEKRENIRRAIALLIARGDIALVSRSRLYRTSPWGKPDQDWFVNACIAVETDLAPDGLLDRCQDVEAAMGRERKERWGPRVIDVDILTFGSVVSTDPRLTIPHPLITERAFVLAPLADIAPNLVLKGRTVSAWLEESDTSGVVVLTD